MKSRVVVGWAIVLGLGVTGACSKSSGSGPDGGGIDTCFCDVSNNGVSDTLACGVSGCVNGTHYSCDESANVTTNGACSQQSGDSGVTFEAGTMGEGGTNPDGGTTGEAGTNPEGGTTGDAGGNPESGTGPEAGAEAGVDSGSSGGVCGPAGGFACAGFTCPNNTACIAGTNIVAGEANCSILPGDATDCATVGLFSECTDDITATCSGDCTTGLTITCQ